MIISKAQRPKIVAALLEKRTTFDGTDTQFARQFAIAPSVYSRLKTNPEQTDGMLRDAQWLNIARELDLSFSDRKWNAARTDVFCMIEEDITFCKTYSKSFMLCDDCGIGKTFAAKYLSRTLKNVFYVDASQCPGKSEFIRALAKVVGVDDTGKLSNALKNIKYALRLLPHPVVIVDEAGALDEKSAMIVKELWNATENTCGWYLMGADGLRAKIERNITNRKVGWAEIFSRFNDKYNTIVPVGKEDRIEFYKKLIADVLMANMKNTDRVNEIVRKCLSNDSGRISGLRRAETLVLLYGAQGDE